MCKGLSLKKIIRQPILIIALSVLAGCVSGAGPSGSDVSDRTQSIVIECSNGWAKCVATANKMCGSRGYDELDRMQDMRVTASGRVDEQHSDRHIYREDVRIEDQNQTLVIRCK